MCSQCASLHFTLCALCKQVRAQPSVSPSKDFANEYNLCRHCIICVRWREKVEQWFTSKRDAYSCFKILRFACLSTYLRMWANTGEWWCCCSRECAFSINFPILAVGVSDYPYVNCFQCICSHSPNNRNKTTWLYSSWYLQLDRGVTSLSGSEHVFTF